MSTNLSILLVVILLMGGSYAFASRFKRIGRNYRSAAATWAGWLPVAATGFYLAVLAVNLAPSGPAHGHALSLFEVFSTVEMAVLFLVGPLYLTRIGNILAIATAAYCIERLLAGAAWAPNAGLLLVTGAATTVAILGDRMPWLAAEGVQILAYKMREIALAVVTTSALGILVVGIFKAHALGAWTGDLFGVALTDVSVVASIAVLFVSWLVIALDTSRRFMIALLSVPTLLVLAYVTAWPSALLIVPFTICLCLSLALGDRRLQGRRRATGFKTTAIFLR